MSTNAHVRVARSRAGHSQTSRGWSRPAPLALRRRARRTLSGSFADDGEGFVLRLRGRVTVCTKSVTSPRRSRFVDPNERLKVVLVGLEWGWRLCGS